jgi:oligopeptide transport system ATP-binding protein
MYAGWLMETASVSKLFTEPCHPYTEALLAALPNLDHDVERLKTIPGEPPDLLNLSAGCPFQERCPKVNEKCSLSIPLQKISPRHVMKCSLKVSNEGGCQ